jgi:hypothetical protein
MRVQENSGRNCHASSCCAPVSRPRTESDRRSPFVSPSSPESGFVCHIFRLRPPKNPSPVGSFSKTNPPNSSTHIRHKSRMHWMLYRKNLEKTVGSFRRNVYGGPSHPSAKVLVGTCCRAALPALHHLVARNPWRSSRSQYSYWGLYNYRNTMSRGNAVVAAAVPAAGSGVVPGTAPGTDAATTSSLQPQPRQPILAP